MKAAEPVEVPVQPKVADFRYPEAVDSVVVEPKLIDPMTFEMEPEVQIIAIKVVVVVAVAAHPRGFDQAATIQPTAVADP